jgi:predicted DNA-binding transcriptional regulator AlpA
MPDLGTIYDMKAAAALCNLSVSSFEKLLAAGDGPVVIQLAARRVGFAASDLQAWLYSRRRARVAKFA